MSSETITRNDLTNIINEIFPATTEDMTQAQIDAFIASLNFAGTNAVDYVVEQGTSGIWTYRKWSSGIAECWGIYSASIAVNTQSAGYGGYRSGEISCNFPFEFTATPTATAVIGSGSQGAWVNNSQPTTAAERLYLSSAQSQAASTKSIHIYVIGRWK